MFRRWTGVPAGIPRTAARATPVRRVVPGLLAGSLLIAACSSEPRADGDPVRIPGVVDPADGASGDPSASTTSSSTEPPPIETDPPATSAADTTAAVNDTTTTSTLDDELDDELDDPAPTTTDSPEPTESTSTTTTTTVPLPDDVFDPDCVVRIQGGDSLGLIADRFDDPTVTPASLQVENGILEADIINEGALLDVCVDNGLDDVSGAERVDPAEAAAQSEERQAIVAQQEKLNELFAGYGIRELLVDGISGPVTRQRLCAARLSLGLPVTLTDMEPGSDEEDTLMAAEQLHPPFTSALGSDRWVLIDRTCQVMFAGEGAEQLTFVFPTSTGEQGWQTRDQDRSRAFRFDPALHNNGWHNSSTFPVAIDNPLNGNMYRPIYFDGGQAIHGSNNVPTTPQSKGCARLRVADQDALVAWLGLDGLTAPTWSENRIGVTVNVQGAYPHA